jgi:hypothetical protein
MPTLLANLPRHHYIYVCNEALSQNQRAGVTRASWFGLVSLPNKVWGATVLLENGAVYTPVPLHAIRTESSKTADYAVWTPRDAQRWDCFGYDFTVIEYEQLAGRDVDAYINKEWLKANYLFTAQHYGDSYSQTPEQAKQYHFVDVHGLGVAALPTNCCVFHDRCFTKPDGKPDWLRVTTEYPSCEETYLWDKTIGDETA